MTDEKIYDLFQQREDKICERFEGNIKTLTEFIAIENQGIKKSIDMLTEKVEKQNSSVKHLNEWKAGIEGAERQKNKGFAKTMQVVMFVVAFGALLATVYFGYHRTKKDVANMLDQYSFDVATRSWTFQKDSI